MSFTRLEITHGFSNQQDQLARAELFIFSNCRDPHNVVVSDKKKRNNYNCSVHLSQETAFRFGIVDNVL